MPVSSEVRFATGIPGLDDILHGGLLPRRLYLVDGNPGAGKTTLAMQYLLEGVKRGERCMYITLSETPDELRAGAASHGWTLDGIEVVELSEHGADFSGEDELTMFLPSEVELSETTRRVLEHVQRVDPERLVFDSLSEMRLLAQSSLRYRRQILAQKQFFAGRRCTVMMLDDSTGDGADLQLQSIAHGVISLEHRAPSYGRALRQLRVVKFRGSDFRSGFHHIALTHGGIEVYPRLAASEHRSAYDHTQIASGVSALDRMLGGGVDVGTSTLLIGPAGSGKSTVALQYAAAAAKRGEHALVFTFDESKATMVARSVGLGIDLREGVGPGRVGIRQVDPAEISPGEFAYMVREAVETDEAKVIVIDSLNGYMNEMVDGEYLTAQLHELLAYLGNKGVSTFPIAAQTGIIATQMGSPGDASYLADSVIYLRYFEHAGRVRKAISVLKKRSGSHEHAIRELQMNAEGLHLSEPLVQFRGTLSGIPVEVSALDHNTFAARAS
ncbi:MAG: Circadian clock protein kinase KaiC [Pseudomonadota bacterium]